MEASIVSNIGFLIGLAAYGFFIAIGFALGQIVVAALVK